MYMKLAAYLVLTNDPENGQKSYRIITKTALSYLVEVPIEHLLDEGRVYLVKVYRWRRVAGMTLEEIDKMNKALVELVE